VPHGAKTYLAAALALGKTGERLVWVARDAEIGDRVAEELGAWLGDPEAVAVLEPRTALAYERSELVPDETAARVASLAAWRSGGARILVASVQALLQHTISPDDLPAQPRRLTTGTRASLDALARELLDLGYVPVLEVAGRGEFARRGGILDVFPPSSPLPVRIEFFGDEIDSLRAFDPADQRTVRPADAVALLPASEFLLPASGVDVIAGRLGRAATKLPERLGADLVRFGGEAATRGSVATRALRVGDAVVDVDDEVAGREPLEDVARDDPAHRLGPADADGPEQLAVRDEDEAVGTASETVVEAALDERDCTLGWRFGERRHDAGGMACLREDLGEALGLIGGEDDARAVFLPAFDRFGQASRAAGRQLGLAPPEQVAARQPFAGHRAGRFRLPRQLERPGSREPALPVAAGEIGRRPVLWQVAGLDEIGPALVSLAPEEFGGFCQVARLVEDEQRAGR